MRLQHVIDRPDRISPVRQRESTLILWPITTQPRIGLYNGRFASPPAEVTHTPIPLSQSAVLLI